MPLPPESTGVPKFADYQNRIMKSRFKRKKYMFFKSFFSVEIKLYTHCILNAILSL